MMSSRKPSMASTYVTEKRISQWEELMRKFSEAHKEQFKAVSLDIPRAERSTKYFPTGSQYVGSWDVLGMSGYGKYTFPNGVIYEGEFEDGMFHGKGQLCYEGGIIVRGKFVNGVLTERTLLDKNMEYSEQDWEYCKMPDRRFEIEYNKGLKPSGDSYLTADQPTRDIPLGYYDTGDGFYDPKTKVVFRYEDMSAILRSPSVLEQQWILNNCRKNPEEFSGPCPKLYEEFIGPEAKPEPPPSPAAGVKGVMASFRTQSIIEDVELSPELIKFEETSQELLANEKSVKLSDGICDWLKKHKEFEATEKNGNQSEVTERTCNQSETRARPSEEFEAADHSDLNAEVTSPSHNVSTLLKKKRNYQHLALNNKTNEFTLLKNY